MKQDTNVPEKNRQLILLPLLLILSICMNMPLIEGVCSPDRKMTEANRAASTDWSPVFVPGDNFYSVDFSPDERLVVTLCSRRDDDANPEPDFVETVRLWDFNSETLLAEAGLKRTAAKKYGNGSFHNPTPRNGKARFAFNGRALAVLLETTIYVLRTDDLKQLGVFRLAVPVSTVRNVMDRTIEHSPHIVSMEISPVTNRVAVLWNREYSYGRLDLYDLATGKHVHSWEIPSGGNIRLADGIAWNPEGTMLALAIPDEYTRPDILLFDAEARVMKRPINSGFSAGSIAFISDNRILAVEHRDRGLLLNRNPHLRVFDIANGKCVNKIPGRGGGVRYFVKSSADGKRFLAYTGRSRMVFNYDYEALLSFEFDAFPIDSTITVWSGETGEEVATSPHMPELRRGNIRLSPRGTHMIIENYHAAVYRLPE